MSYPYRGAPMGRGYGHPTGNSYYAQQGGGPPIRPQGGPGGYMPHSDFEASPPAMRGGPSGHFEADSGPRGGSFGRGYAGAHGGIPQASPLHAPGGNQDYPPRGRMDSDPAGSASGFESGSNSDAPQSSSGGPKNFANDCEIVVLHKSQQQYGEMVERELRKKGLKVDIMFPKGEVKVQEFLKPIAKLGTIFAVVIDVDNEQARTVNFYQFRGHTKPQYHKNVPLNMAYGVIVQKYNELKQKEIGIIPDGMKNLLQLVLKEETLQDNEYTALVRFLQERRKRQNAFLNRTSNVIQEHKTDVQSLVDTPEGKELQKRILTIMNDNAPLVM